MINDRNQQVSKQGNSLKNGEVTSHFSWLTCTVRETSTFFFFLCKASVKSVNMVSPPVAVLLILTVLGTVHGRHTANSPNAPNDQASQKETGESAEISEEKPNLGGTKYRLDFNYDGADERDDIGPFASYQFEGGLRTVSTTTEAPATVAPAVNTTADGVKDANSTTTAAPTTPTSTAATVSTTPVKYGNAAPVSIAGIAGPGPGAGAGAGAGAETEAGAGDEDEGELVVSTTPFKVDSLGSSVVKINNTGEDDSSEEQCDEGEVKRVKCNTCVCADGVFFCSKKPCPEKDEEEAGDGPLSDSGIFSDDAAVHLIMEKVVPVFGSQNSNKNGQYVHGTKNKWNWKKKAPTTPLPDCTNGMTKTIDCNNCLCTKGRWHCTKSSCIALSLREKASYTDGSLVKKVDGLKENHNLDEDCMEGATREANCNQCVCHYNSWSCTNLPCSTTKAPTHIKEIEEACQVEGDVKSKECNICRCKRGVWVCTTNNCMVFGVAKIPYVPPKFRNENGKRQ